MDKRCWCKLISVTAVVSRCVNDVLERFGRVDVLVNNAGSLVGRAMFAEQTDEFFDNVLNVNARPAAAFTR